MLTFIGMILSIDCDDPFLGLEVWARCVCFGGHPHSLALASDRLGSAQIGQDNMAIKVTIIDIFGGSIKARSATHHALGLLGLALFPDINLILRNHSIKWYHGKLCDLGQLI